MTDPRLIYLPDAIKRLQGSIGEREWNGEEVPAHEYEQLAEWRGMVKVGQVYQPTF